MPLDDYSTAPFLTLLPTVWHCHRNTKEVLHYCPRKTIIRSPRTSVSSCMLLSPVSHLSIPPYLPTPAFLRSPRSFTTIYLGECMLLSDIPLDLELLSPLFYLLLLLSPRSLLTIHSSSSLQSSQLVTIKNFEQRSEYSSVQRRSPV